MATLGNDEKVNCSNPDVAVALRPKVMGSHSPLPHGSNHVCVDVVN